MAKSSRGKGVEQVKKDRAKKLFEDMQAADSEEEKLRVASKFEEDVKTARATAEEDGQFAIIKENIFAVQVCTTLDVEVATERLNNAHPAGTSTGWGWNEEQGAIQCSEKKDHKHYVFQC